MTIELAHLVIFESDDGRDPWRPVKETDVPAFVKRPDVLHRLANGEECMDCGVPPAGSCWYRAVRVSDIAAAVPGLANEMSLPTVH